MGTQQISAQLDDEIHRRLMDLAACTGRSESAFVAEFIERGLDDAECFAQSRAALDEFHQADRATLLIADVDWV